MLLRIESNYFVAGCIVEGDVCIHAAPIIRYMIKWPREKIITYIRKKGWEYLWEQEDHRIQ